jgi:hypothetical protein
MGNTSISGKIVKKLNPLPNFEKRSDALAGVFFSRENYMRWAILSNKK